MCTLIFGTSSVFYITGRAAWHLPYYLVRYPYHILYMYVISRTITLLDNSVPIAGSIKVDSRLSVYMAGKVIINHRGSLSHHLWGVWGRIHWRNGTFALR